MFHYLSLGGDTSPTLDHFSVFDVCGLIQWSSEIISMLVMSRYFVYGYFPAFNIVSTHDQHADYLTKPLNEATHVKHRNVVQGWLSIPS